METPFATLRRFVRPRKNVERCEMCSLEIGLVHPHLVEPTSRQVTCACEACALLFSGKAGTKYKRVPRSGRFLSGFCLSDGQWDALSIPIQLAFFYYSSPAEKIIALYPSPAGPTESLLTLEAWDEIVQANPILTKLEPDVEALLVNRVGSTREYYIAPIDQCYKLVGLIRANWKGFSGGQEVWQQIGDFFKELKDQSAIVGGLESA
jgi:Family of unknown function (DUF5947)